MLFIISIEAPQWLKKWAVLVLEFIQFEAHNLPTALVKKQPEIYTMQNATVQASGVENIRIQNLAITLDKVVHLLKIMNTSEPPIRPLSEQEVYYKLWKDEKSLYGQLMKVIEALEGEIDENSFQFDLLTEIRNEINSEIIEDSPDEKTYATANNLLRQKFTALSRLIKRIQSISIQTQPLSDILYLYAFTKSYFTPCTSYVKVTSTEVEVRLCDVTGEKNVKEELVAEEQAKPLYCGIKEYDSSFIWGQLAGWFKQTVDKPNASLSAGRRGALSYPDLESFIIKATTKSNKGTVRQMSKGNWKSLKLLEEQEEIEEAQKKKKKKTGAYPTGEREDFYKRLLQTPSFMWPLGNNWTYKNREKMYGSIQFESVKQADENGKGKWDYLKEVIDNLVA